VLKAVKNDFSPSELLSGTSEVLLVLGGDHGGGVFRMHLRMLVRKENGKNKHHTYQIGQIDTQHDKGKILQNTIGKKIQADAESMGSKLILKKGGVFGDIGHTIEQTNNIFSFIELSLRYYATGDLKYYFQLVGRENMSTVAWDLQNGIWKKKNLTKLLMRSASDHGLLSGFVQLGFKR